MLKKGKTVIYFLWILIIIGLGIYFFLNPDIISADYLVSFIQKFQNEMLIIYTVLSLLRGFFLIPSTPFVIGGGLLFPDQLLLVLAISIIGVLFSATSLYYFSDLLGFSAYLEKKFPTKIKKLKNKLDSPKSTLLVAGWSIFPLVPTDIICYVTGILKTPFKNVLFGVFIGEIVLCSLYVYFGERIYNLI
jgi:uncharacterized membrane protein YdjX (TVP38/TMEM64 family)